MNNTFILLSRSLLDSEVFASQKMLKIWIWCLLKANYKDRKVPLKIGRGERVISVKRGEFIFGRFKAENELYIDGSTIYKILKKLEQIGNISIKSNNQYSIISICNYNTYQDPNTYQVTSIKQPSNNQVTSIKQPSNTNNKDNKVKKDKNIIYNVFYDSEIENTENTLYKSFVKFLFGENEIGKKLSGVLKIENQITVEQFEKLVKLAAEKEKSVRSVILEIENGQYYKNKKSFYLTVNKWLNNERYN